MLGGRLLPPWPSAVAIPEQRVSTPISTILCAVLASGSRSEVMNYLLSVAPSACKQFHGVHSTVGELHSLAQQLTIRQP